MRLHWLSQPTNLRETRGYSRAEASALVLMTKDAKAAAEIRVTAVGEMGRAGLLRVTRATVPAQKRRYIHKSGVVVRGGWGGRYGGRVDRETVNGWEDARKGPGDRGLKVRFEIELM